MNNTNISPVGQLNSVETNKIKRDAAIATFALICAEALMRIAEVASTVDFGSYSGLVYIASLIITTYLNRKFNIARV